MPLESFLLSSVTIIFLKETDVGSDSLLLATLVAVVGKHVM